MGDAVEQRGGHLGITEHGRLRSDNKDERFSVD